MTRAKLVIFAIAVFLSLELTSKADRDCLTVEIPENKSHRVAIVVNDKLAHEIHDSLEIYLKDLRHEHYDPVLLEWQMDSKPDALTLRDSLKALYHEEEGLHGAVLIGDLPSKKIYNEERGKTFVEEEYFRNLVENPTNICMPDSYGSWYNFKYDASEIWTSRIVASPLRQLFGATEPEIVNEYFKKNHAYRTGKVIFPKQNLLYSLPKEMEGDEAFSDLAIEKRALSSGLHQLREYAPSRVEEFIKPLKKDSYEMFLWARHGSNTMLLLGNPYTINNIFYVVSKYISPQISGLSLWDKTSSNLNSNRLAKEDIAIATAFTFANSCSLGDFLTDGYLAGTYIFNKRTFVMGMIAAPKPVANDFATVTTIELFLSGMNLGSAYKAGREAWLHDLDFLLRWRESSSRYILGDGTLKIYSGETNAGIDPITYLNSHNYRRGSLPIRGKEILPNSLLYRVDTD